MIAFQIIPLFNRCKDEYMDEAIEVKRLCGFAMFMGELFQHIEVCQA